MSNTESEGENDDHEEGEVVSFKSSEELDVLPYTELENYDVEKVLPTPKAIRSSREKIALFAEQGVAQELLSSAGGILGADGTPLAYIGKTLTTPITIGGKLRAINNLAVANETRDNLVTRHCHYNKMAYDEIYSIFFACSQICLILLHF